MNPRVGPAARFPADAQSWFVVSYHGHRTVGGMDMFKRLGKKAVRAFGESGAEKVKQSLYGLEPTPFELTEQQIEILNSIYLPLLNSEKFAELVGHAVTEMQSRITPAPDGWKIVWALRSEIQDELFAIGMTDVLTKREHSAEMVEFFAEYVVGRFLADGTQRVRTCDNTEQTLEHLELLIAENGEHGYRSEVGALWDESVVNNRGLDTTGEREVSE